MDANSSNLRSPLRRGLLLGAVSVLMLTAGPLACSSNITDRSVLRAPTTEVAAKVESGNRSKVMIVDSRNATMFAAGHIPGAVNIRLPDLREERWEEAIKKPNTIIVYGQNPGSASAIALAKRMMEMGVGDVRLYEQGFDAWRDSGLAVERGD